MWIKRREYDYLNSEISRLNGLQEDARWCHELMAKDLKESKEMRMNDLKRAVLETRAKDEKIAKLEELLKERESRIDVLNGDLKEAQEQLEAYKDYYEGEDVETECEDCPFPQHDEDEYQELCIRLNEARATIRTLVMMMK